MPTLWFQDIRHICSLVGMRVDQKVLFVNYALVRSGRRKLNNDPIIRFLPLSQVFSEKTLEYSHLVAELQFFFTFHHIRRTARDI